MACRQSGLLYPGARGAKNTCREPVWVRLGGVPGITSIGLSHGRRDVTGKMDRLGLLGKGNRGKTVKNLSKATTNAGCFIIPTRLRFGVFSKRAMVPPDGKSRYESARMYITLRVEVSYNKFL